MYKLVTEARSFVDSLSAHGSPANYRAAQPKTISWNLARTLTINGSSALLAPILFDGSPRKIAVSDYGGYFFDEQARSYYQLPKDKIDAWNSYIQHWYMTLIKRTPTVSPPKNPTVIK